MKKPFPAYKGDQPYVFVCYAHEDAVQVYDELRYLQSSGVNVWYDEGISPGEEWTQELADAIQGASHLLFFVSPASVASRNCRNEIQFAAARRKPIVSVHIEPTKLPGGLELSIGLTQAILKYEMQTSAFNEKLLAVLEPASSVKIEAQSVPRSKPNQRYLWATLGLIASMLLVAFIWMRIPTNHPDLDSQVVPESLKPPVTAIAVLPFDDLSAAGDQEWLANGMAEELIESLGRIKALHVPARSASATLKNAQADIDTIGEQLDVGSIVTGSIRRSGNEISVVTQWTRIEDGTRLWSARYERTLDDVFAIQKEIAIGIAEAIRTELGIDDAAADFMLSDRYQTSDVRAWELLQRSFGLFQTWQTRNYPEARRLAQQAIALDPNYVAAYGVIAYYDLDNRTRRVEAARQTFKMDKNNVHANMVLVEDATGAWDVETAEKLLDRAVKNNPNAELLRWEAGVFYDMLGRTNQSLAARQHAVRLAPTWNPYFHYLLGRSLIYVGKFEEAIRSIELGLKLLPPRGEGLSHVPLLFELSYAYQKAGREQQALETLIEMLPTQEKALREAWETSGWQGANLVAASSFSNGWDCPLLARAGAKDRMLNCLTELFEASKPEYKTRADLRLRWDLGSAFRSSYAYRDYHQDPRFKDLARQFNERLATAAGTYPFDQ